MKKKKRSFVTLEHKEKKMVGFFQIQFSKQNYHNPSSAQRAQND
jgi:hypothetical protein